MQNRKVSMERFFNKKQAAMKEAMDKKERSIEFANALNNAVALWVALVNHPEISADAACGEVMDLVKFFRGMKDQFDEEDKAEEPTPTGIPMEEAKQMVHDTFPGSEETTGKYQIKEPNAPISDAQRRKIYAIGLKLYGNEEGINHAAEMILGLGKTPSIKDLTKSQASRVIEELMKLEAKRGA